jgi:hypothetical protein
MAETAGLVQRLTVLPDAALACAWIGPSPTNTELLFVARTGSDSAQQGAFKSSIVDALMTAVASRREVVAIHGNSDAEIIGLRIDPA